MTKEQIKQKAEMYIRDFHSTELSETDLILFAEQLISETTKEQLEGRDNEIRELEEKISVLLFCKNCPENKGGFICQKEYEGKCLAQKIQYIKELKEEIAELGKKVENLQKYLDTRNCYRECAETWLKLTEAKKLLKQFLEAKNGEDTYKAEWEAEQFLSEVEK